MPNLPKPALSTNPGWMQGERQQWSQTSIVSHLDIHARSPEARFVYKSWLDAGGKISVVKDPIINYLASNIGSFETSFVISPWLKAKGEWEVVKKYVKEWLRKFHTINSAYYHLSSWLTYDQVFPELRDWLGIWLSKYASNRNAYKLLHRWIESDMRSEELDQVLFQHLPQHLSIYETSYALQAWVRKFGYNGVERLVEDWLEIHGSKAKANYMIQACLDSHFPSPLMEDYVLLWMTTFPDHPAYKYVSQKWEVANATEKD